MHLAMSIPRLIIRGRGDDTIGLFTWMEDLREEAEAVGGYVLSHLGNHEWMNVIGAYISYSMFPSHIACHR